MKKSVVFSLLCFTVSGGAFAQSTAQTVNYSAQVKSQETKYHTPEDIIAIVPVLNKVSKTFQFSDYTMKLAKDHLQIDHHSHQSHEKGAPITCTLGLSYTATVSNVFSSQINVPLFDSPSLALSDWSRSPLTNYNVLMSRPLATQPGPMLVLNARF